ncbi:hypothetical protein L1987_06350 [Smallanthus sonchifolius]|uniref:Uncharacterized protein n=1 Tax=Smallanthus sonchifolius TaxID=185202 RepID=A0ACB9JXX5_9ASTR|nr:hypothetical protein L1987_06350 [Smallanthus sonchifolius]
MKICTNCQIKEDIKDFALPEIKFKFFFLPTIAEIALPEIMDKKQVAIVGAGVSGLLACKYCLSKGFHPIVFDTEPDIGGVWAKTIKTTTLQSPKPFYQFSDFPWPTSVTDVFPTGQQIRDYLRSYATHFDLIPHIRFHSRVKGISYDGPSSETWSLWNGTGEPFPPEGKWNVTVESIQTATTQVYTVDFVILCLGRFKDVPNIPEFPAGKGPEVFRGQVIHSMEYAAMDAKVAEEFVKGKKVVVVGFGKTGLDIARECSSINVSKFVESHIKRKLPLTKFNIVPQRSFSKDIRSCKITYLPNQNDFFDEVEKGSIKLKKSQTFSFYNAGILIGDDHSTQIEAEVVIYATGFKGVQKLKDIFESSRFGEFIAGSPRVPLYRECIHPQIPQLAIIGFSESLSNLYISEMRSKWLVALLEGVFKLPSVKEMQKDIVQWDDYMNQSTGEYHYRSSIGALEIWYNDQLCKAMGMNPMRKNGPLANLFEPYGPIDYTKIEA